MSWINDPVNSPKHYTDSHPGMECIDLTADGNHKRTFQSLEERGYTQDVGYGRYAITEAGRRALQKDLS